MAVSSADDTQFRLSVVAQALRLFGEQGYEATTVDEIAEAAGISRRTFFRQFHGKEDVVFADHELLLAQAAAFLDVDHADPWQAVCDAAMLVFERFAQWQDMGRRRYRVVHEVPALRDREIVTTFRYERLFVGYLRRSSADPFDLRISQFAAAVTATHNFLLRRMMRDGVAVPADDVRRALAELRNALAGAPSGPAESTDAVAGGGAGSTDVVVAVFDRDTAPERVAEVVRRKLASRPTD